jgi:hypothetical protein
LPLRDGVALIYGSKRRGGRAEPKASLRQTRDMLSPGCRLRDREPEAVEICGSAVAVSAPWFIQFGCPTSWPAQPCCGSSGEQAQRDPGSGGGNKLSIAWNDIVTAFIAAVAVGVSLFTFVYQYTLRPRLSIQIGQEILVHYTTNSGRSPRRLILTSGFVFLNKGAVPTAMVGLLGTLWPAHGRWDIA